MSFLKLKGKFNWRYAIGEILLIFIGINLAIWFNNWNSSKKSAHDKEIAIAKITEEIESNSTELNVAQRNNQLILLAYLDYQNIYNGNTSEIISSPKKLSILQRKYPNFFRIKDSIEHNNGLYRYKGGTNIDRNSMGDYQSNKCN